MKINKKIVSHFLGLAVLLGAVELTHQLTKTEKQTTYSVTLESLVLGNGETDGENIWYVDPETRILYHSNGASGCTDSCPSGYGPARTRMCHIVTGGTLTMNDGQSFTASGSGSMNLSLTGVSGSLNAGASGTRTLSRSATYNWVPGTITTCSSGGENESCNWQNCR